FQAEDGIRDRNVTGVQTCALPILIINKAESLLSFFNPNAATIPNKIGTNVPARAVALGTNNARTKLTIIVPNTKFLVFVPTLDMINKAILLSNPVISIACAKKSAPATSATADELKPLTAIPKASFVP